MGKSTTGPDEWDVMAMMSALAAVHTGHVEVNVSHDGRGFGPQVMVTCRATFDALPGSELPTGVTVENVWPCKDHPTLWAHAFDGLYRLDAAIQLAYEQAKLPNT
jgi:hypothetical protein